jgi:hypothetical protein
MDEETITITEKEYKKLSAADNREYNVLKLMKQFTKEDRTGDWLALKMMVLYQGQLGNY